MKKRVKRKGRRSVIEINTADFNKEFRSQPPSRVGRERERERELGGSPLATTETRWCLARRTRWKPRVKKKKLENSTLLSLPRLGEACR